MPDIPPPQTPDALLQEMLESAHFVRDYVAGMSFDDFWDDYKTRDAVAMRLIAVGEAARYVNDATVAALPAVPFPDIRAMRHRIAHHYRRVDFKIVWETAHDDIPPLIAALEAYFAKKPPVSPSAG